MWTGTAVGHLWVLGPRAHLEVMADPEVLSLMWPLSVFITLEIKTEKFKSTVLNYLKITIINPQILT